MYFDEENKDKQLEAMNNFNNNAKSPFVFTEYDKISDVLMWFDYNYYLKLNVKLSRNDKDGNRQSFHTEFKTTFNNNTSYSIRRDYNVFYTIECKNKELKNNYVILYPGDVYVLNMLIRNNIIPWFLGSTRIFGKDNDDQLFIKYNDIQRQYLPLTGGSFLSFYPVVFEYNNDQTKKEGINIGINHDSISFDTTVDKFFQFTYIMSKTDMVSAAIGMINYVKSKPYLTNFKNLSDFRG